MAKVHYVFETRDRELAEKMAELYEDKLSKLKEENPGLIDFDSFEMEIGGETIFQVRMAVSKKLHIGAALRMISKTATYIAECRNDTSLFYTV